MTLHNGAGEQASRQLRVKNLEYTDGEKSLMVFDTPRDVRGSALLSYTHPQGEDEQWLYLPAIKRVKQIGARNKSGPFMASEFAFEDIITPFWQKFSYGELSQDTFNDMPCYVLNRHPNDRHSGYKRQRVWIDQEHLLIRQVEYYDRRDQLLKVYQATDFTLHQGQYWRPALMTMRNVQTGKHTTLAWSEHQFGQGLNDRDFSQNALLRAR
ncbi:outer membrane lipoprotein-sorting protein [Atopomonas sediminilitoris]|uniref:outer membrane lipoprotein-sorting protein n=1 Tax=Atopomonas sediminilitoris TaxID=2919919 RepID=UPI001F4D8025|nr:outer membrane lipoprotein-sorting protein [Atopomonas sediminilitoris]MCJ8169135.1 outer membrane lipoprotein-sorting protein [Atopomonas sediminilitoris]